MTGNHLRQWNRSVWKAVAIILSVVAAVVGSAPGPGAAYTLPAERAVTWEGNVGVPGDLPSRILIHSFLVPSGGDDTAAIQAAIDNCLPGQVVMLAAGAFNISSPIIVKSGITLRGTGMGGTILKGTPGMTGAYLVGFRAGYFLGASRNLSAGMTKGSTTVTTDTAHDLAVGDLVLIDQLNDPAGTPAVSNVGFNGRSCTWCGRSSGTRSLGQIAKVVEVPGPTTATLEIPLYWNYSAALAAQITKINGVTQYAGIESLTVDNSMSGSVAQDGDGATIGFYGTSNCWLLNVEAIGSYKTMVRMRVSYRDTIRNCKLHEGVPALPETGAQYGNNRAYGVWMNPASAGLMENNQVYHLVAPVVLSGPASGNVFAGNYFSDLYYSPNLDWQQASISMHGGHPMMNLFEANWVVGRLSADSTWGSSSHNTFFRNRNTLDPLRGSAAWNYSLYTMSGYYNIVGNVIGTTGVETDYSIAIVSASRAIYGIDPRVPAVLQHANWDSVTGGVVWNSGDDQLLPNSLYLAGRPPWCKGEQWPVVGADVSPMFPAAPAAGHGTPWDRKSVTAPFLYPAVPAPASGSANLTWSLPATYSDGAPVTSLAGYRVFTGTASGSYSASVDVGNLTSHTLTGLPPGTTHYFAVRAFDSEGLESGLSNEISYSTPGFTITASAGAGGSIAPSGTVSLYPGGSQSFSIAPDAGFQIALVTVDGVPAGALTGYSFENVTSDHSIAATFTPVAYTITASAGSGGAISPSGAVSVNQGDNQGFTVTPDAGYQVEQLMVDDVPAGPLSSYTFTNVTANHTIAASFTLLTGVIHTIIASAGAGGAILPTGAVTVNEGESRSFTITPDPGYTIVQVVVDGTPAGSLSSYTFDSVASDHTISASFVASTYLITASAGTGGAISPSGAITVNWGEDRSFVITPDTGYQIAGVTVDGVPAGPLSSYSFTNVSAGHTIAATFAPLTCTVTASAGAGGSISPSGAVPVTYGADRSFTITPAAGYRIAQVSVDSVPMGAVTTYSFNNVTADHTISATFSAITYTITASAGAGGSITPSGAVVVNAGANQSFTITPAAGYRTDQITVDGAPLGALAGHTFYNVTANHSIAATFSISPVSITTATLPAGSVGVPYSQAVAAAGGTPPYTWARSAGTLPTGLALSSSGVISGTPAATGSFSFTLRVTAANGSSATRAFTIQVISAVSITTTSLPAAGVGVAYSRTLAASGGTTPYAWARTAGTLPNGLTLSSSGVIRGTPTRAGSFSFTVRVTAANGSTATRALSIAVSGTPPAAPGNLRGSAVRITGSTTQDRVTLYWNDNSNNESSFQVQRSLSSGFSSPTTYTFGANVTTLGQNASRSYNYYYRVRALNASGSSSWSNTLYVTTP